MDYISGDELRTLFLDFFKQKGHKILPSASLIPNDPQLLFTIAGMVPFKPIFWGKVEPVYPRVATAQKCLRTNDIENVGRTPRHQTFLEMLGNFSFGDYFKREAIQWAWEFMTRVLKVPEEKLWISVFENDDEAFHIWRDLIGIDENRIVRMGKETNFWGPAGPTGPCGPCSEIFYDTGISEDCPQGKECTPANSEKRFVEVWNLVFTEYYQDEQGTLNSLPRKNIDTGAGLERLAAMIQGVPTNFDTDLFKPIIRRAEDILKVKYGSAVSTDISLRVVADHARAVSFLIADGVFPANEGRGYVLRRILRRAVRHGVLIGAEKPFLYEIANAVIERMKHVYPELEEKRELIRTICKSEEKRFFKTIFQGMEMLQEVISRSRDTVSGEDVFRLYDTYGFPPDIVLDTASENGMNVDMKTFEKLMNAQRERARKARGDREYTQSFEFYEENGKILKTRFVGYSSMECESEVKLIRIKDVVDFCKQGQTAEILTVETPFYAEKGGQVSDTGIIEWEDGKGIVKHVFSPVEGVIVHMVDIEKGTLKTGQKVLLKVDSNKRWATMRNHTATHLLHSALRKVLGTHVKQSGSLVSHEKLRFDFTHYKALSKEEIQRVEDAVNEVIMKCIPIEIEEKSYQEAVKEGALAFFEEKYGDFVRVVKVQNFSEELCGGTHVSCTGNIGLFKILSESAISAGVRRIEAVTGFGTLNQLRQKQETLDRLSHVLDVPESNLESRLENLVKDYNKIEKRNRELEAKLLSFQLDNLESYKIGDVFLRCAKFENVEPSVLRNLSDTAIANKKRTVLMLFSTVQNKVTVIIRLTRDLPESLHAGSLAKLVSRVLGGGGGGRHDFAQAGGSRPSKIPETIKEVSLEIRKILEA